MPRLPRFLLPCVAALAWGTLAAAPVSVTTQPVVAENADLYVKPERLAEWSDWRFGLFIHWGPWSQTKIGYIWKIVMDDPPGVRESRFDLNKTFDPVNFAPERWARAAKEAGMKYVVFVVKHHDGFNNYDTALSDYKSTAPDCPWSRSSQADITRAVFDAFRKEGLAIGIYYSHIDWHHPDGRYFSRGHWDYDAKRIDEDPASWDRFVAYEKGQLRELLTQYGKIDIMWFDINWPYASGGSRERITHPKVRRDVIDLIRMMKTLQPDLIFNDRGTDVYGGFSTPEQRIPENGLPGYWESNITITNERGFWFKGDQVSAKSPQELVRMLVEIAAKGGNFLMNVGPRPDGELSPGEYAGLAGVGEWMKVNSASIYGTTRSLFHDLPWGRSTTKGRTLFLHVQKWPADGRLVVPGLRTAISAAYLLADPARRPLAVEAAGEDKIVVVGAAVPDQADSVVVLDLAGDPDIHTIIRASEAGDIVLGSGVAGIKSATATYNYGMNVRAGDYVENLKSNQDELSWSFAVAQPGRYRVEVTYAARAIDCGGEFRVRADGQELVSRVQATGEWTGDILDYRPHAAVGAEEGHNVSLFKSLAVGEVSFAKAGVHAMVFQPVSVTGGQLMYLRKISLVPIK